MNDFERPAPDIAKIVEAWRLWQEGGEDALPGRTVADLKIGGADMVLQTVAGDVEQIASALEAWSLWERGKVGPEETLAQLAESGFGDVVDALESAA